MKTIDMKYDVMKDEIKLVSGVQGTVKEQDRKTTDKWVSDSDRNARRKIMHNR